MQITHPVLNSIKICRLVRTLSIVGLTLVLAGCAHHYTVATSSDPYGFFSGLWHGIVFPFALLTNVLSWLLALVGIAFLSSIEIVGRPNTGVFFYYVGFALGLSVYGGSGSAAR
jgi:hypothetical protein